jgi:hypothetical protein
MKRLTLSLIALSLISPPAMAATKPVALQLGSVYSAPATTEAFALSGKNSVFIENINGKSADVLVTAVDPSGLQIWKKTIDSGIDEVASAMSTDPLGNIWVAGLSAQVGVVETTTPLTGIDNPDGVAVDTSTTLRADLSLITLWKISPTGELLSTITAVQKSVAEIAAISATNSGISIIGALDAKPFLLTVTGGVFGKLFTLGTSATEFNAVARNSDGSTSIFGSSSETLAGKKVAGIRDGILLKVSKGNTVTSLVRSSANKASRSWISGDTGNLVSGPVIAGKVIESAITKFSSTFSPQWTLRVPSTGPSTTLSANGNSYLALSSKSPITGVTGWKPTGASLIVLTFDSKGVLKAATSIPGLVRPISLQFSASRGVVGLGSSPDGIVSIFTLVSR